MSHTTPESQPKAQPATTAKRGIDILSGSLWTAIPLFALPVAATSILEQLSNLIGVVMIGQFSGDAGSLGMAAVGSNTPIASLILNLFIGLSLGTNVVIAHAIGRGDHTTVERATHTSVAMAGAGIAVTIIFEILAEPLLHLLNVPPETLPSALLYLRVYLLGMPSILLYNFEAAIFRSVGITKMPLQALALSSVLNILLDLLFIPVFGWGVAGCALATVLSYTTSASVLFFRLLRAEKTIRITPSRIRIDVGVLRSIVKIGLPAGIQSSVFAVANIVIQACINSLGTEAMAASSAAMSLEYVCYNLLNSFSQACTTFVGQNSGARQIDRCRKTLKVCLIEDGIIDIAMITLMLLLGRQILTLFNGADPQVVEIGYLRVATIFPAYTFSMVYENLSGYLRGFGISLLPAVLTTIGVCGIRLLWVQFVFPASPTFLTVMLVYPISLGATCLMIIAAVLWCRPAKGGRRLAGQAAR